MDQTVWHMWASESFGCASLQVVHAVLVQNLGLGRLWMRSNFAVSSLDNSLWLLTWTNLWTWSIENGPDWPDYSCGATPGLRLCWQRAFSLATLGWGLLAALRRAWWKWLRGRWWPGLAWRRLQTWQRISNSLYSGGQFVDNFLTVVDFFNGGYQLGSVGGNDGSLLEGSV